MARHTLYAVDVEGTVIGGCRSNEFDPGIDELVEVGDGAYDAQFACLMSGMPLINFSAYPIATALAAIGLDGEAYAAAGDPVVCFLQEIVSGGLQGGATSHIKLTSAQGLVVPRSITARQGEPALINYVVYCLSSDGLTHPWTIAADQSLAGSPTTAEMYTLGPANVNGAAVGAVQEVEIDFGIEVSRDPAEDGLPYPTFYAILNRRPSIRIRTLNGDNFSTFGGAGAAQGATDSVVYLRKLAQDGARVANATAEHISFTIDEGRINPLPWSAEQGGPGSLELRITPTDDGTNDVLAISTTAAIS